MAMKIDYNNFVVVIVSYFSYGWTQQCIDSLLRFFPECRILAIDNNPSEHDSDQRAKSFKNLKSFWPYGNKKKIDLKWSQFCEEERKWLHSHPNIITTLQTPIRFRHGEALNLAVKYCVENKIPRVVLIEPDCTISGPHWLQNLLQSLDEGYWMASGKWVNGCLHPCPSAWVVEHAKNVNFQCIRRTKDIHDDFFDKHFNLQNKEQKEEFVNKYPIWDTAIKAWYEFAKIGRTKYVRPTGFCHYWGKSSRSDYRIKLL